MTSTHATRGGFPQVGSGRDDVAADTRWSWACPDPSTAAVVVTGWLEAVTVEDGRFTAAVQLGGPGERIVLQVPGMLWNAVRRYLCSRVEVNGRMHRNPRTGRLVLELLSVARATETTNSQGT